jgi:hypothetical protein
MLNSALPGRPEDSTQQTFVALVDQFTEWHLRFSKLFQDLRGWARRHNVTLPSLMAGSPANILKAAYPELQGRQSFHGQIWKDLWQRGLVNTDSLEGLMSGEGAVAKRTSELGDQFLRFIEDPGWCHPDK